MIEMVVRTDTENNKFAQLMPCNKKRAFGKESQISSSSMYYLTKDLSTSSGLTLLMEVGFWRRRRPHFFLNLCLETLVTWLQVAQQQFCL